MNFLVIDGNSLVNRAFFGIKLLTAKDGHYTNAIFGFMNMLLSLLERTKADHVAVAFDLRAPTFRHKRYALYKAGRKGMPPELFEQMEPLKELLRAFGCHIVSCEGYEADDILGTLSAHVAETDHCYIATGDRDSLQLVRENVTVLLTATKMGQTVTTEYTPQTIFEEYGVTPAGMIEIKALQGDSSDNIPGVQGVGPKTAGELIRQYGSIDAVYDDLDTLDIKPNLREKLRQGKESAYLSRELGAICLDAPIETDPSFYTLLPRDNGKLKAELTKHEMFKLLAKLGLDKLTQPEVPTDYSSDAQTLRFLPFPENGSLPNENCTLFVYFQPTDACRGRTYLQLKDAVYLLDGEMDRALRVIAEYCRSSGCGWCTQQTKELFRFALQFQIDLPLPVFDITLAAYLLNPNTADYTLHTLAQSCGVAPLEIAAGSNDVSEDEISLLRAVSCMEGLFRRMQAQLESNDQARLLAEIEIPLARVLASMELEGMAVDKAAIEAYSVSLGEEIERLQAQIYEAAGEAFNINSPKQLGSVLFDKLGLPAKKKTKTGYSTNAEVLESLAEDYPVVALILAYRTYSKLKSTYCDGLLKSVDSDGRIRSTFNQTETRTGRLSSTEPNLQNIPVRTPVGREFRKFFVARDGFSIIDADYSQIELRVLAALSDDKNMIDCFNRGVDIHTVTASKVFGVPEAEVTSTLRSRAKAVNFGIVYGIGAFSLAKDIHSTRAEAEQFISAYLSLYSGVNAYMKQSVATAKQRGYAETLFHRRRYLPELASSNHMLRAFGERVAMNMPIQGTAADVIKIAMIHVYDRLKKELPEAKLIMQVHDELMIEAPALLQERASAILKAEMERAVQLSVHLSVDVGVGSTWYSAKG